MLTKTKIINRASHLFLLSILLAPSASAMLSGASTHNQPIRAYIAPTPTYCPRFTTSIQHACKQLYEKLHGSLDRIPASVRATAMATLDCAALFALAHQGGLVPLVQQLPRMAAFAPTALAACDRTPLSLLLPITLSDRTSRGLRLFIILLENYIALYNGAGITDLIAVNANLFTPFTIAALVHDLIKHTAGQEIQ